MQVVKAPAIAYDITVDEFHNFCVTIEDLCVHNVLPFVAGVTFSWAFGGGFVPAISGLLGLGAFVGKALFDGLRGGAIVPNSARIDFDDELFSRLSVRPRPSYMAGKEDSKDDKKGKGGQEKPEKKNDNKKPEDKNLDAQAPGKPTEADGFTPPKNWNGEKEGHRRGWGWRDKRGSIWIPTGPKGHGCPHWDVQHKDGTYENIVPGGRRRGEK